MRRLLLQLGQDLEAGLVGQLEVQQGDLGGHLADVLQRGLGGGGDGDAEALALKKRLQRLADLRLIINQEDVSEHGYPMSIPDRSDAGQ